MVLGIIGIAAGAVAIPLGATSTSTSVIGIAQGTQSQQSGSGSQSQPSEADKNDPRLAKFTITTECDEADECDDKQVVLRNGKLYLDERDPEHRRYPEGHPFSGFYVEYPWEQKPLGLVSTIKPDPPELNWIYVDKYTQEVKYGNKTASIEHLTGRWDWTPDQQCVVLEGWKGFLAFEERPGDWVVCYDRHEDGLTSVGVGNRQVVAISLKRNLL
ncbi:hypothetical protein BDZ89DRAFT_1099317 [Hymenopellis radicata]|nr:hypothetical protein BDZ89DRAFT_1099317 [Hymenopellis radicata]